MLYLGIDQHARQLTISLRDDSGDVLQARQAGQHAAANVGPQLRRPGRGLARRGRPPIVRAGLTERFRPEVILRHHSRLSLRQARYGRLRASDAKRSGQRSIARCRSIHGRCFAAAAMKLLRVNNPQGAVAIAASRGYLRAVRKLADFCKTPPDKISEDQFRRYFLYLKNECRFAPGSLRVAWSGAKFFFTRTCRREWPTLASLKIPNQ